eukprot:m.81872 g.81872  ORF g.81872 m.81872 type:complete len:162 (-) comp19511_c0_seq2:2063-2548(-)
MPQEFSGFHDFHDDNGDTASRENSGPRCGHPASRGTGSCTRAPKGAGPYCGQHTCKQVSCSNGKPSTQAYCDLHVRKAGLASVAPGGRCVTDHYGKGTVRFVGTVTLGSGVTAARIGVELDAPRGKNDGTAFGVRYFRCRPDHGVFVLPSTLKMTHAGPHV